MRITAGIPRAAFARITVAGLLLVMTASGVGYATPSTPEIDSVRDRVREAQSERDELAALAELRGEEYAQIAAALSETKTHVEVVRVERAEAEHAVEQAQERLENRVHGMYRNGSTHILEVLLGTTSFEDFLTRVEWLRRIGDSDAALVAAVREARERAVSAEQTLNRRMEEQTQLRAQAEAKKREVDAALAQQQRFLDELDAEVARLVAEEEERLRREAEERARIAAEEARRAAERAAAAYGGANETRPAAANDRTFDPSALGAGNHAAVTIGMQYLGVPYVWGGSTPAGFDCSGLVQYVYRELGIALPRTSREQFRVGAYIPPDRRDLMLPGDLVFFGYGGDPNRVHHVGIFVGGGDYLHAPMRGQPVQVQSLDARISNRGDFVGATRP